MIQRLAVKGEPMIGLMGEATPEVFVGEPEVAAQGSGLEFIASVPIPIQYRFGENPRYTDLPVEELGLEDSETRHLGLELINRSDCGNEIVVMGSSLTTGKLRMFFAEVPAGTLTRINLSPLRDCDDVHLISWQSFDAFLVMGEGESECERMPIPVRGPGERAAGFGGVPPELVAGSHPFSGGYLFGYFEKVVQGEDSGSVSLNLLIPDHGDLLHLRYACEPSHEPRELHPFVHEGVPNWIRGTDQGVVDQGDMTVVLVSDSRRGQDSLSGATRVNARLP